MYRDYRELLEKEKPEVVTIGTPDHWHVPISIAALRAGADVYCEKPLTLTIQEGIDISKVVQETGRVFQVGTQQRSENDNRFLKAIANRTKRSVRQKRQRLCRHWWCTERRAFRIDGNSRGPRLGNVGWPCTCGGVLGKNVARCSAGGTNIRAAK